MRVIFVLRSTEAFAVFFDLFFPGVDVVVLDGVTVGHRWYLLWQVLAVPFFSLGVFFCWFLRSFLVSFSWFFVDFWGVFLVTFSRLFDEVFWSLFRDSSGIFPCKDHELFLKRVNNSIRLLRADNLGLHCWQFRAFFFSVLSFARCLSNFVFVFPSH